MSPTGPSSTQSEASSSASSPYFQRRYEGKVTRREVLEKRLHKTTKGSPSRIVDAAGAMPLSPPRLDSKSRSEEGNGLGFDQQVVADVEGDREKKTQTPLETVSNSSSELVSDSAVTSSEAEPPTKPQHMQLGEELNYYRIVYRGVVSLLSKPAISSPRSGAYVSYGEIIASAVEIPADNARLPGLSTPSRASVSSTPLEEASTVKPAAYPSAGSPSSETPIQPLASQSTIDLSTRRFIRVDRVLTGGYSIDAVDSPVESVDKTPKRGNTHTNGVVVADKLSLPLSNRHPFPNRATEELSDVKIPVLEELEYHGYIDTLGPQSPIAIPMEIPPRCEQGSFMYKVVSSTPLAVYTGPCLDAPKTKGMLVPGTIHEVCLRMQDTAGSVSHLRLARRRGWVADRRHASSENPLLVMKEITGDEMPEESLSVFSVAASSVATPVSVSRRRHRPPRRRRDTKPSLSEATQLPRHVLGPSSSSATPQREQDSHGQLDQHKVHSLERSVISPSSNVSLLSDESSHDQASGQTGAVTPDRSVARSSVSAAQPSFYLFRVTAPRGLKILDAPHFQVNNLIHGNLPGHSTASPMKDLPGQNTNQSIFQTMTGHHTTALTSKIGSPAVFDSITRARRLPRASVFEASKRMEPSGAFNQGAGLIKLSDNSGWAIVPKQEDLDEQYSNFSGSLAGTKEGEATRAYEEVGNAILDARQNSVYMRIVTRGGVSVSLPPPSGTLSDDETSPTSSAGGSSAISGAFGSSQVISQDSDVTSSVGSSFLDAMFRTPRKREADSQPKESRRESTHHVGKLAVPEKTPFSSVLHCGMCVEVEKWVSATESGNSSHRTEFARLRGGQGWVPRHVNRKPVAEIVPPPEFRFGSFWFRVEDKRGIKVRYGPSKRATSIKSDDGVYFRFECGEFLRASEVITFFLDDTPSECYAKLYRNRHVRLHAGHGEVRPLSSLTAQSEWVQVFGGGESFLEECGTEPRIERHRQGWRYNVVLDSRVQVRKGPSFQAESNGVVLLGGESVLVNERVLGPDESTTWLRLKDGQGWVYTVGSEGETLMIPHSLRHRRGPLGRPSKSPKDGEEDIAYNAIIARLFHSDSPDDIINENQPFHGKR